MARFVWALSPLLALAGSGCESESQSEFASASESSAQAETGLDELHVFGLVTATHYPADAAGVPESTELAAGLREAPFEGIEDLVSVVHLQTTFAPPRGELDEILVGPMATPWSFGAASQWLEAGDGLELRAYVEDSSITGCRQQLGNFNDFPVYLTGGEEAPEVCRAEGQSFESGGDYALVVFGGELFADEVAAARLVAPESFDVSAPDLGVFKLELAREEGLELAWTGPSEAEPPLPEGTVQRFVVRLWDEAGTLATIVAEDDGALSLSPELLAQFEAGPATLTLARESLSTATLAFGEIDVVLREEHWGYLELN